MSKHSYYVIALDVPVGEALNPIRELGFPVPLRLRHLAPMIAGGDFTDLISAATGIDRELVLDISISDLAKIVEHLAPAMAALDKVAKARRELESRDELYNL